MNDEEIKLKKMVEDIIEDVIESCEVVDSLNPDAYIDIRREEHPSLSERIEKKIKQSQETKKED